MNHSFQPPEQQADDAGGELLNGEGEGKMKILLIEDDIEISDMLNSFLTAEGFEVVTAYDGESGCEKFFAGEYSLVLLDLMIPKKNGMEVMKLMRQSSTVPIIIISAKDTDSDKTLGFGLGADDYITKPFSVAEVLARIKANIRRNTKYASGSAEEEQIYSMGGLTVNAEEYSVMKRGERISLTAREFEILKLLMKHPKRVYTKEQIYSIIWDDGYYGDENAVTVQMSRLRGKIEDDPQNPRYVVTVWGIGYKFGEVE